VLLSLSVHYLKNYFSKLLKIIWYILLYRQSKKKKNSTPDSKVSEEIDHSKNTMEIKQEGTIDESTPDEVETKVDETVQKELDDTEEDTNLEKNDKEVIADESLADVESLPESQPEQPTKSSKSSKRSTDQKSKSRSSRASKYVMNKYVYYVYVYFIYDDDTTILLYALFKGE